MREASAARMPETQHTEELRRRGAELARPQAPERASGVSVHVVFSLGAERYALDARAVIEVVVLRDLMPLPGARAPLFGLTHWRGRVISVLDLREAFGVRIQGVTDLGRLVVVDGAGAPFGIMADAVRDLADIDAERLRPLQRADEASGGLVAGVTEEMILVVDAEELIRRFSAQPGDKVARRSS